MPPFTSMRWRCGRIALLQQQESIDYLLTLMISHMKSSRKTGKYKQALFGFEDKIRIQHIQSHRDAANGTLDFDDWTAHWNGGASHEALAAHLSGSHEVEDLRKQMVQHHCTQISYLKELTELHFEVAQTSFDQSYEAQEEPEDEEEGDKPQVLDPQRICLQQDLWQLELPPELPQIGEVVLWLKSSVRFLLAVCSVGFGV